MEQSITIQHKQPEWFATTDTDTVQKLTFSEIYPIKQTIDALMVMWPTNSYYVNAKEKYFIIHGGQRIQIPGLAELTETHIFYAKRTRKDVKLMTNESMTHVSYLLGIEGLINDESRVIFLEISDDGQYWRWKFER